jgi:2,3-bisphosphoglycerate-independent phosphoglycerate mutase
MIDDLIFTDDLILTNDNKIIFLVLDGLGDIPDPAHAHQTPLEAAKKPNMDSLAMENGVLGRTIPVGIGITPGSGPGHLSLFGYDPVKYEIGRGILEVLGLNMDIGKGDVAARGNFCTVRGDIVSDRRAGRIETALGEELCGRLSKAIPEVDGVRVTIKPGVSHRFGIIFSGVGLCDKLEDADPHKDNLPRVPAVPKSTDAEKTARVVNAFIKEAGEVLKGEKRANGVLLRGFSQKPDIPLFPEKYRIDALAITTYPMYRGIGKLLGMKVEKEPRDYADMVSILREHYDKYQFFFMHIKETDTAGEDGNFEGKKRAIESVDTIVQDIYQLKPKVLVITGDHSTPCALKGHSWHPVPLLIVADTGERDGLPFHEKNCLSGSVGTIYAKELMALALAYGSKLDKFGA